MREDIANRSPDSLVKSYGTLVSSLCRRMIKNEEEARDAAQEAWIEILRGLPEFRGGMPIFPPGFTQSLTMRYCAMLKRSGYILPGS